MIFVVWLEALACRPQSQVNCVMSLPWISEPKDHSDAERKIIEVCFLRWRLACAQDKLDNISEIAWAAVTELQKTETAQKTRTRRVQKTRGRYNKWLRKQPGKESLQQDNCELHGDWTCDPSKDYQ